tara:strand:+ start:255 stop:536 length:282 start_codon:yes stop_codon:yes gene_type:complete
MTQTAQIKCINKTNRASAWERISHVGGFAQNQWKLTLDDAIGKIERGEWKFYVSVGGDSVWVDVAVSASGNKYLKTRPDGDMPNNLLSLPECP